MKSITLICMMLILQHTQANNKNQKSKIEDNSTQSLLWEISGNSLSQKSYLFGTIHAIPHDDYFFGKNATKKLKECKQLVMELDLSEVNEAKLASLSLLPDDVQIHDFITEEEYNQLEDFLIKKYGMNKAMFENVYIKLKPFYIEQFILLSIIGEHKKIYENEINMLAEDYNIRKIGLEKLEEQLASIDSIPLKIQYQNLIQNLNNYDEQVKLYHEMVAAYKKQDLNYLHEQFEKHFIDDMQVYKKFLLDDRNNKWIVKIKSLINQQSNFIAVGAGHLAGKNGLIQLLQNEGYTLTPININ